MIFSKDPNAVIKVLKSKFIIKSSGPPDYYLGNDFKKNPQGQWTIGCRKYIKDALSKVMGIHGDIPKRNNPCEQDIHLECDQSPLLNATEHRQFQQLVGILNWIMQIGRVDIAYATISLARFVAAPRRTHLQHALYVFGYLRKFPNARTVVNSCDPDYEYGQELLKKDLSKKMKNIYSEALEDMDHYFPKWY